MTTVTNRIKEIKQPKGGYINPKDFLMITLKDEFELYEEENISPTLVGLVVDYMTRFLSSNDKESAFRVSLLGAKIMNQTEKAEKLLSNITGLNSISIINACKLCGYDVCYRKGKQYFKIIEEINPDNNTIFNI